MKKLKYLSIWICNTLLPWQIHCISFESEFCYIEVITLHNLFTQFIILCIVFFFFYTVAQFVQSIPVAVFLLFKFNYLLVLRCCYWYKANNHKWRIQWIIQICITTWHWSNARSVLFLLPINAKCHVDFFQFLCFEEASNINRRKMWDMTLCSFKLLSAEETE